MARVRPFAGWRYASDSPDISSFVAPPYDVISGDQRAAFLDRDERNVVALELPEGPMDPEAAGNRYETGRTTWDEWRASGVLVRDAEPAIYVLAQRYELAGRLIVRRAFIGALELEPFDAGVVLPHERTLPKALGDRFELIKSTGANFSQVFGLFEDAECASDAIFDEVMATEPLAVATDADGVESTLWACTDATLLERLDGVMAPSRVFIADGHHRYTTALAYRDLRREEGATPTDGPADEPGYDYVMMALVNIDDPELVVLPTHRIADGGADFDPAAFKHGLERHFCLTELPPGHPSGALDGLDRPAFLIKTAEDDRPLLAVLRADVDLDSAIPGSQTGAWKRLDVAVLQELVLDPLLGIHPDRPETLERLSFVKDAHDALASVPERDVAFVLRPTGLDQLRSVALAGEIMPQKSTYFYPKLLSGLVMRSAE